ncbi:hypothetical protein C1E47_15740 [Vibrio cholerae]|nr:hypothetical protein [Vibrio cholerae]EII3729030.1 hypothetical protein [Vibrio cholerae]EMA3788869.1 hypothetical protein [Vibrio cholerae]TVN03499.1 hypothetical protein FPV63_12815 [Vibrio cholerae]HAS5424196.1 hypothetical protein [Vibrio cholerae]
MTVLDARVILVNDSQDVHERELNELERLKKWAVAVKSSLKRKYRLNGKKKSVLYDHVFTIMILRFIGGCSWKEIELRLETQHDVKVNKNTIIRFFKAHVADEESAYLEGEGESITSREINYFIKLKREVLNYIRAYKNEKNNKKRVVYPTSKLLRFTDVIYMLRNVDKRPWTYIAEFLKKHHRFKRTPERIRVFFKRFSVAIQFDDFYVGPGEYRKAG